MKLENVHYNQGLKREDETLFKYLQLQTVSEGFTVSTKEEIERHKQLKIISHSLEYVKGELEFKRTCGMLARMTNKAHFERCEKDLALLLSLEKQTKDHLIIK